MKNRKAILLKKEIEELQQMERRYLDRIQKKIKSKATQLEQCCLHNDIIKINEYKEGGFDYVSETIIETRCAVCNILLNIEVTFSHE